MHAVKSKRKGHEYLYYNCSKHCGAPVVHMEVVDNTAKDYLHKLLSKKTQEEVSKAMQLYQIYTDDTEKDFKKTINKKVREKETLQQFNGHTGKRCSQSNCYSGYYK